MRSHIWNRCGWLHSTWSSWIIETKLMTAAICVSFLWGEYENNCLQRIFATYCMEAWWRCRGVKNGGRARMDAEWSVFDLFDLKSIIHSSLTAVYNLLWGCGREVWFLWWHHRNHRLYMTAGFWFDLAKGRH